MSSDILRPYIKDGEININEDEWLFLNNKYTQMELTSTFIDAIEKKEILLPLRKITYKEAREDFKELCGLDTKPNIKKGKLFTRYDYSYPLGDTYFSSSNVGNLASDYFQQENRFHCGSINAPSPVRTWNSRKFMLGLFKSLWTLKTKSVNSATLRTSLSLRKYTASQFKPSIAKTIYDYFEGRDVLDFSSGWGDRLCGFFASNGTKNYTGTDPNTKVWEKYSEQIDLYMSINPKENVMIHNSPAEDIKSFGTERFDLIFTSPPYFNIERYTEDDRQSFKRYKKFDVWMSDFLFVVLRNTWQSLKKDGILAINVSDVYSNHTIHHICDPMNDYISSVLHGQYVGGFGIQMAKRPNSGALKNKNGTFIEPLWVWKK